MFQINRLAITYIFSNFQKTHKKGRKIWMNRLFLQIFGCPDICLFFSPHKLVPLEPQELDWFVVRAGHIMVVDVMCLHVFPVEIRRPQWFADCSQVQMFKFIGVFLGRLHKNMISRSDTHHQPSSKYCISCKLERGQIEVSILEIFIYWKLFFLTSPCKVILPCEALPGHSSSWQSYKSNVQRWSVCRMPQKIEQSNQIDHELQCLSRQVAKRRLCFTWSVVCVCLKNPTWSNHINISIYPCTSGLNSSYSQRLQ